MKRLKGESFNTSEVILRSGIRLLVWSRVPTERKPTVDNIGQRVWIAGDTSTKKTKLLRVHKKGDKQWPTFGGYTIITEGGLTRDLHQRAVRLHPRNFVKKRKIKS
jgi:hypothetical protein